MNWPVEHGFSDNKQSAADAATDAWWRCVATGVPRDIECEVILIAARVMVRCGMALYYFDIIDGHDVPDIEGREIDGGIARVRDEALEGCARNDSRRGPIGH